MAIGPFTVGEEPSRPLAIDVCDSDGQLDLTAYDTVEVEAYPDLPAHGVTTDPALPGRVQIDFDEPFTEAGNYKFRIVLSQADGDTDITTGWLSFDVTDVPDFEPVVTTTEVYQITGETVSEADIAKATSLASLMLDRDLYDTEWMKTLDAADTRRIKTAISFWATSIATEVESAYPAGVTSISSGGQSISFASPTAGSVDVPAKAMIALRNLSWLQGGGSRKTDYIAPFITDSETDSYAAAWYYTTYPDAVFNPPVVRINPVPDDWNEVLWEEL